MFAQRLLTAGQLPAAIALVLGALTNLAFEPFGLFPVAIVTLAVLFRLWCKASPRHAAWLGLAFGFGFYSVGVSWIYISVHEYGGAQPMLAAATVLSLAGLLAIVIALIGFIQAKVKATNTYRLMALVPALWVLGEWIRSWLLSGFPWLYVGYSQTDSWLVGWAPLTGVLGVSLTVAILAGALALLSFNQWRGWLVASLGAVAILGVGYFADRIDWTEEKFTPIRVAIVQGDVTVIEKWDRQKALHLLNFFIKYSQAQQDADLVVWPEIALPYADTRLEKIKVWQTLRQHPADFLVGTLEVQKTDQSEQYFNSAYGVTAAEDLQKYRKSRLVPFGEYMPFQQWLNWLHSFVELPASDLSPYSASQQPLRLAGQTAGVSICYEDAFPSDIRKMLPQATFLVNISEDAWFGERLAPYQRLQMSRMRAIETARPVIRAANKGISVAIDHRGQIIDQLTQAEGKLLRTAIVPTSGATPFVRFGFAPTLVLCAVLIAVSLPGSRRAV